MRTLLLLAVLLLPVTALAYIDPMTIPPEPGSLTADQQKHFDWGYKCGWETGQYAARQAAAHQPAPAGISRHLERLILGAVVTIVLIYISWKMASL